MNKIGLNAPENEPHSFALYWRAFWVEFVAHGPEGTIAVSMATMHLMTPTWGVFVHPLGGLPAHKISRWVKTFHFQLCLIFSYTCSYGLICQYKLIPSSVEMQCYMIGFVTG